MAEPVEYRRIFQKVDTYDGWMANPLILGDGEQAFVRGSGVVLNFRMGDGTKRFSELYNVIQYDQAAYVPASNGILPDPENGIGYSLLAPGTYNNGDIIVPDNNIGKADFAQGVWTVSLIPILPVEVSETFDPNTTTVPQGGKQIADYLESYEFSNQSSIGSSNYTTPFGRIDEQRYYFNNEFFDKDKFVNSIESFLSDSGQVVFAFGRIVDNKFVERKTFTFTPSAPFETVKTYPINDFLYKGEVWALKTPSNGMAWRSNSNGTGKLSYADGYNAFIETNPAQDLAIKINVSDFERKGYTPISLYNELDERLSRVEGLADSTVITIGKLSGDFRSLKEAVFANRLNSTPLIMVVQPGTYLGTVELQDVISTMNIKVFAQYPKTVKILQNLGDYDNPPMHVWVNSYFNGLVFESTQTQGVQTPSSYCVHADFRSPVQYPTSPTLIEFEDCVFNQLVTAAQAVGSGSWNDNTQRFKSCRFLKNNSFDGGALYWHNKVQNGFSGQRLEVFDSYFQSSGGATLQIHDANQTNGGGTGTGTSQSSVLFVNNTFNPLQQGLTPDQSFMRMEIERQPGALVGNIMLDKASHGNNIDDLNF